MSNDKKNFIVDIQTAKTDYQIGVIQRAANTTAGLAVATVEDLIVLKLIANRPRDLRDIDKLLEWNNVDWAYIEHWAEIWDVTPRMEMVREALGNGPP